MKSERGNSKVKYGVNGPVDKDSPQSKRTCVTCLCPFGSPNLQPPLRPPLVLAEI